MKHRHHSLLTLICMAIALAIPAVASAQTKLTYNPDFAVDDFNPLPAQGTNILNMAKSDVASSFHGGLFLHALGDPLKYYAPKKDPQNGNIIPGETVLEKSFPYVHTQAKAELSLGWGFADIADISVVVPFVIWQDGYLPKGTNNGLAGQPLNGALFGSLYEKGSEGPTYFEGDKAAGEPLKEDGELKWTPNDLRLVVKLRYPDRFAGVGFGLMGQIFFPILAGVNTEVPYNSYGTGNADDFLSSMREEVRGIIDWKHEDTGITLAANLGYQHRPERQFGNFVTGPAFLWNAGIDVPFTFAGADWLGVVGTLYGEVPFVGDETLTQLKQTWEKENKGGEFNPSNIGVNWAAALQFKANNIVTQVGGGGTLPGLKAATTPFWRAFLSVGYTPMMQDADGDGIPDDKDQCPNDPEDKDGFQDEDGCPDPDNDQDSIFDVDDNCPNEPGPLNNQGCPWGDRDGDGIMDNLDNCPDQAGNPPDGCPSFDRDGDGIPDDKDQCPDEAEDKDGFQDADGCPDTDNDNDGIPDAQDKCPNDPEDKDGFEDEDGCPDLDNDNDGIPDTQDKCPNEPETINGYKDDDGCPDKTKEKTKVRVTETKIEILEKVFFATNKATIRKRSYDLLNQVAAVLKNYKRITQVRIDGYTDSRGRAAYNLRLSQDRADSVRKYLIDRGISPSRLLAKGYGEEDPIDTNDTAAGRERNRRVEFTITEVNGKPVSTNSVTVKEREVVTDE